MDFTLSKEQRQIQKAVRDFVKGEFDKNTILELEENHQIDLHGEDGGGPRSGGSV